MKISGNIPGKERKKGTEFDNRKVNPQVLRFNKKPSLVTFELMKAFGYQFVKILIAIAKCKIGMKSFLQN